MEDNIKTIFSKKGCEDGRWMELALDCVQWQVLVLVMLNSLVLLTGNLVISKMDFRETGCEGG